MSVIVDAQGMESRAQQVLAEIRRTLEPDALEYVPKVALVAVVVVLLMVVVGNLEMEPENQGCGSGSRKG